MNPIRWSPPFHESTMQMKYNEIPIFGTIVSPLFKISDIRKVCPTFTVAHVDKKHLQIYDEMYISYIGLSQTNGSAKIYLKFTIKELRNQTKKSTEDQISLIKKTFYVPLYIYSESLPGYLKNRIDALEKDIDLTDKIWSVRSVKLMRPEEAIVLVDPDRKMNCIRGALCKFSCEYKFDRYHCSLNDIREALED